MRVSIPYDKTALEVSVPEDSIVYLSAYPEPSAGSAELCLKALRNPIGSQSLKKALEKKREGKVVVVVSDITRPIPYYDSLPALLAEIETSGVRSEDILILIATGMHRPSTAAEREYMFGDLAGKYPIEDHDAEGELAGISGLSFSGSPISLNKSFVNAGFRIITGLVEPHFMAGFSGGRKAVCPGLVSLETIQSFHGYEFLSDPKAANGVLDGNPCHEEALSIARLAGVDFSLNVVLNKNKKVVRAFAGSLEAAHDEACKFVRSCALPKVRVEADAVVTGGGGYPLDATFYQCVKGITAAIPAVKRGGMLIAAGGCREGLGSREYRRLMRVHSQDYMGFLSHIRSSAKVEKDQWQLQMQSRALEKTGADGLIFLSSGLDVEDRMHIAAKSVHAEINDASSILQKMIDRLSAEGKTIAIIPEGPYCAPVQRGSA